MADQGKRRLALCERLTAGTTPTNEIIKPAVGKDEIERLQPARVLTLHAACGRRACEHLVPLPGEAFGRRSMAR